MKGSKKTVNTRKIIPIVICVILALILLLGIVLGTVSIVKEALAVVSYSGITMDGGVASYLKATYKVKFIEKLKRQLQGKDVNVTDTNYFWSLVADGYQDTTYGDLLERDVEKYVRSVAVGAYLFDRYSSLDAEAREWISTSTDAVLLREAQGSREKFNELASPMGFDWDDFEHATELIYKAEHAMGVIYGEGGSVLSYAGSESECNRYFSNYKRIRILYIRTQDKFVIDEETGNRVTENGKDKTVALTDAEKAERRADIADIKASINAIAENTNGQMSEEYFNSFYLNKDGSYKYNDDPDRAASGYYFAPDSAYTASFAEYYPEAVNYALEMQPGDFDVAPKYGEDGTLEAVLVLYCCENERAAYANSAYAEFFTDFYSDAAVYLFAQQLDKLTKEVNVKDGYRETKAYEIPKNPYLVVG